METQSESETVRINDKGYREVRVVCHYAKKVNQFAAERPDKFKPCGLQDFWLPEPNENIKTIEVGKGYKCSELEHCSIIDELMASVENLEAALST